MGSFPETYVVECEPLTDMWLSILEIGAVQHRSVTKIAPKQQNMQIFLFLLKANELEIQR